MPDITLDAFQKIVDNMTNDLGVVYVKTDGSTQSLQQSQIGSNVITKLVYGTYKPNAQENQTVRDALLKALQKDSRYATAEMQKYINDQILPQLCAQGDNMKTVDLKRTELKDILVKVQKAYKEGLSRAFDFGFQTADIRCLERYLKPEERKELVTQVNSCKTVDTAAEERIRNVIKEKILIARSNQSEFDYLAGCCKKEPTSPKGFMSELRQRLDVRGVTWDANDNSEGSFAKEMNSRLQNVLEETFSSNVKYSVEGTEYTIRELADKMSLLKDDSGSMPSDVDLNLAWKAKEKIEELLLGCTRRLAGMANQVSAIQDGVDWLLNVAISDHLTREGKWSPTDEDGKTLTNINQMESGPAEKMRKAIEEQSGFLAAWKSLQIDDQLRELKDNPDTYDFYAHAQELQTEANKLIDAVLDPNSVLSKGADLLFCENPPSARQQLEYTIQKVVEDGLTEADYADMTKTSDETLKPHILEYKVFVKKLTDELTKTLQDGPGQYKSDLELGYKRKHLVLFRRNIVSEKEKLLENYKQTITTLGKAYCWKTVAKSIAENSVKQDVLLNGLAQDKILWADYNRLVQTEVEKKLESHKKSALAEFSPSGDYSTKVSGEMEVTVGVYNDFIRRLSAELKKEVVANSDFEMMMTSSNLPITEDDRASFTSSMEKAAFSRAINVLSNRRIPPSDHERKVWMESLVQNAVADLMLEIAALRDDVLRRRIQCLQDAECQKMFTEGSTSEFQSNLKKACCAKVKLVSFDGYSDEDQSTLITNALDAFAKKEYNRLSPTKLDHLNENELLAELDKIKKWDAKSFKDDVAKKMKKGIPAALTALQKIVQEYANALKDPKNGFPAGLVLDEPSPPYDAIMKDVKSSLNEHIVGLMTGDVKKGSEKDFVKSLVEETRDAFRQYNANELGFANADNRGKKKIAEKKINDAISDLLVKGTFAKAVGPATGAVYKKASEFLRSYIDGQLGTLDVQSDVRTLDIELKAAIESFEKDYGQVLKAFVGIRMKIDLGLTDCFKRAVRTEHVPDIDEVVAGFLLAMLANKSTEPDPEFGEKLSAVNLNALSDVRERQRYRKEWGDGVAEAFDKFRRFSENIPPFRQVLEKCWPLLEQKQKGLSELPEFKSIDEFESLFLPAKAKLDRYVAVVNGVDTILDDQIGGYRLSYVSFAEPTGRPRGDTLLEKLQGALLTAFKEIDSEKSVDELLAKFKELLEPVAKSWKASPQSPSEIVNKYTFTDAQKIKLQNLESKINQWINSFVGTATEKYPHAAKLLSSFDRKWPEKVLKVADLRKGPKDRFFYSPEDIATYLWRRETAFDNYSKDIIELLEKSEERLGETKVNLGKGEVQFGKFEEWLEKSVDDYLKDKYHSLGGSLFISLQYMPLCEDGGVVGQHLKENIAIFSKNLDDFITAVNAYATDS